jgi:two-component system sensor histidine kinase and response regulator WspE
VKAIREDDRRGNVPIIIVSYKDREEDRLRGLELGANFYLTKSSFHDNTFLQAVADLIGEA